MRLVGICTFEKAEPFPTLPLNSTNSYGNMPVVIIIKHPNEFVYDMVEGDTRRLLIVPENELLEAKMIMKIIHEHFLGLNQ